MYFNLGRPAALRYAAAAGLVVVTVAGCWLIGGVAAQRPFIPLFFAVILAAIVAGPGPGVYATVLAATIGDYLFLSPVGSLAIAAPDDSFRLAVFAGAALFSILGLGWYGEQNQAAFEYALSSLRRRLRQEADAAIEDSEVRYRLLFETSRDGIVTTDMSGVFQDANPAFQEMLGYTLNELKQLSFRNVTPAHWHAVEEAILQERILPHGDSGEYDKEYIRKDGSVFPVSLRTWPVYDETGKIVGLRAFVRDCTDRKRAEEALKEADRRKDEFLATLAHELRNPLAPIRNAVYLLNRSGTLPEARDRKLLAIADRQVQHLIRLVDDLLDFSRISGGKIELRRSRIDLAEVLSHAIETAQPAIQLGGHELQTRFPDAPLTIDGDPVRLAQVFTNLLDNAAKYTEAGGKIALTAERQGDHAMVIVRDSGVGIPAAMLPEIFDYFAQVNRTLGRARGGLGIGLALVRKLLELHGGTVEAQSAGEGHGSVFIVRLPTVSGRASLAPASALPARAPRRVLIIDDEVDVADSFAALLDAFGANPKVAYCCEEGLEALREFRPELILLDLGMPTPDGYETARRIRALPEGQDVVLVALSGWGKAQVEPRFADVGFDGHLTKPAELAALNALLGSLE
jgi:PAS domain S-box-containing protein